MSKHFQDKQQSSGWHRNTQHKQITEYEHETKIKMSDYLMYI